MNRQPIVTAALLLLVFCLPAVATHDYKYSSENEPSASPSPSLDKRPKLSSESRVTLIRGLQSEHAFLKVSLPMGRKGIKIKDGVISPAPMRLAQIVAREGAAAKAGQRVQITNFKLEGDQIVFEIDGGPRKGPKWYQRIEVSGMGGATPVSQQDPKTVNAKGSVVTLQFKGYIPEMTVDEVKKLLTPVFDFTPMSQAEAYQSTLPKIVQDAIKNHKVLVGMDREMVIYAVGRPGKKYRDKDESGNDYEEWIYGTPPSEVQFVRFLGNEVARLEIMTVDGQKVIKTEREFQMAVKQAEPKPENPASQGPKKRPSLLGPGERPPEGTGASTPNPNPPMSPDSSIPGTTTSPTGEPGPGAPPRQ